MKKRMSKLLSLFCAAVLVMGVFAGCSTQKKLQKVTVSEVTHSVFYAPQYAAIELGFFEEEGLELELSNGEGADKVMTAVLSGSVCPDDPARRSLYSGAGSGRKFHLGKAEREKPAAGQKRRRTVYDVGICGQTTRHDPRC